MCSLPVRLGCPVSGAASVSWWVMVGSGKRRRRGACRAPGRRVWQSARGSSRRTWSAPSLFAVSSDDTSTGEGLLRAGRQVDGLGKAATRRANWIPGPFAGDKRALLWRLLCRPPQFARQGERVLPQAPEVVCSPRECIVGSTLSGANKVSVSFGARSRPRIGATIDPQDHTQASVVTLLDRGRAVAQLPAPYRRSRVRLGARLPPIDFAGCASFVRPHVAEAVCAACACLINMR